MATPLMLNMPTIANTGQLYVFSRPVSYVRLTCTSSVATDGIYFKLMNANAGDSLAFNNGVLSPAGTPAGSTAGVYGYLGAGQTVDLDYFIGKNPAAPASDPLQNKYTHIAIWCGTATCLASVVAS